jgi:hypothetical protein
MSEATDLLARIARLQEQIAQNQAQLSTARQEFRDRLVARLEFTISQQQQQLVELQGQLEQAQQRDAQGTASAGQVVAEEQKGNADNSTTQNPQSPFVQSNTGLNVLPEDQIEFGTDGRIRNLNETQSTPPLPPQPFSRDEEGNPLPGTPSYTAGVGSRSDDNTAPTSNTTAQIISASFGQRIVPQPNVLDEYASYTYAISWYLLTPDQYNEMITSQKRNCAGWQLLMQSGGAATTSTNQAVGIRNKFFNLDYYLDDLEIDSVIPLKGTGAANTATDIKFKVTEPNGISLIENLYKAVSTLYKQTNVAKTPNYPMAQYCLVVRFYGYNDAGQLIQVGKTTNPGGTSGPLISTDNRAVVEKFYPFVISNITFKVTNRLIEYAVHAKPIPHFYNKSQDRGTIPFAFELVGETVSELLIGKPVGTQYPRPDGRASSPTPPAAGPAGNNPVDPVTITGDANQDVGGGTTFSLGVSA